MLEGNDLKGKTAVCLSVLLLLWTSMFFPASARERGYETVKIGFPVSRENNEGRETNGQAGYTYACFQEVAQYLGWKYEWITYERENSDALAEMEQLLHNDMLDILVMEQTTGTAEEDRSLLSFLDPVELLPFLPRIAVSAQKPALQDALWDTLRQISRKDPEFAANLQKQYFSGSTGENDLSLTEEERRYIEENSQVRVLISPNKGPIQYIDHKTGELRGISLDVLNMVGEMTGLEFIYLNGENMDNMTKILQEGNAELLAGIPYDYDLAENYHAFLTRTYLTCPYSAVMRRTTSVSNTEDQVLALTVGLTVEEDFADVKEVVRYPSIEACIQAVHRGEADFTYGNAYVMEFYTQDPVLNNLTVVPLNQWSQNICIAVNELANPMLLSVLNKTISSFPMAVLQNIIMNNTAQEINRVTLSAVISANPVASICIFSGVVLIILAVTFVILRSYQIKNRRISLDHQRYLMIANISNEYFYEYDFSADCLALSANTAALFGMEPQILYWKSQMKQMQWLKTSEGQTLAEIYEADRSFPAQKTKNQNLQLQLTIADGTQRWFQIIRAVIYENGDPVYVIGKMTDIQKEYEEKNELMEKSRRDGLTRLYNSATSRELISLLLRKNICGSLLIIDVDRFKNINDTYGHYAGDGVLQKLADTLQQHFRQEDIVGRLGGDEFVVFIRNMDNITDVMGKCKSLQRQIQKIVISAGEQQEDILISEANAAPEASIQVSVSIGIAVAARDDSFEKLYQRADHALYQVKENGRSGYCFYESDDPAARETPL